MKAIKLSSSETERSRLKTQCQKVLAKAEEIKLREHWNWNPSNPQTSRELPKTLKAPQSQRHLTTREEVILLEGSKLHGFVFPPWKSDPSPDAFERADDEAMFV